MSFAVGANLTIIKCTILSESILLHVKSGSLTADVYGHSANKKSQYHMVDYTQLSCMCMQFSLRGKHCIHL